ncbi:MAG: ABC transporter substrate-binding protein [Treponema sp.]|nr:ABC transporter substrate-binding protein [Treponema sp.]
MKRLTKVLSAAVLACAVTTSLSAKPKSNDAKIGFIGPLSGGVAVYGTEARDGVLLAVEEINAAGGVLGQKLALVSEDDEGDPAKTVSAFKKLVTQDKVKVLVGSLTSGCTKAITDQSQALKVLQIAPAATAENITIDAKGNTIPFVFRACFIDPFQGTVGAKFAAETLNAKNAAILYDIGNDYSVGLTDNFEKTFKAAGGKVTKESYSTGEKDFNAIITKVKSVNPDVVYLPDYYATVALVAKQLRANGITCPIVGGDGWDGLTDNAGDEVLNGFYSNHYATDSTDAAVKKFVGNFKAKFNREPTSFAALAYDSVYMVKDSMIKAGTTSDSVKIRAALEANSGDYVTGHLTFDAKHNPVKSAVMLELVKKDGKLVTTYKTTVNP